MRYSLYLIILLVVILLVNIIRRIVSYSFKAKKYGSRIKAKFVGYYIPYNFESHFSYRPVVKFNYNNEEIYAVNNLHLTFPIYKKGDNIDIKFYKSNGLSSNSSIVVFTNGINKDKEDIIVDNNVTFNIVDKKHIVDIIIEIIVIIIILCLKRFI